MQSYNEALEAFTDAYVTAALWSSTDDNDEPMDDAGYELSDELQARMEADCAKFFAAYHPVLTSDNCKYGGCSPVEYAGHDFWLTRAGHGCGFWDGDWREPVATVLTGAAKAFGNLDLYVGDDGKVYGM